LRQGAFWKQPMIQEAEMAKQKREKSERAKLREEIRARVKRKPDRWLGPDALYRFEYGAAKYALSMERRGVHPAYVRQMTGAWRERVLELRRIEERIKQEMGALGFQPYQWDEVRTLVSELYKLARKLDDWTLCRHWSYKAMASIWNGLSPRAVHRLLYRCWFLIKGSNSLSDLRKLRMSMAACSQNPGAWHVST
jgi:hypothetical protein